MIYLAAIWNQAAIRESGRGDLMLVKYVGVNLMNTRYVGEKLSPTFRSKISVNACEFLINIFHQHQLYRTQK